MTRTSWITGICLGTLVAAALVFPGFPDKTAAHEMHGHESGLSMRRQHQAMDDIQREWLTAREAAEKGDAARALSAASRLEAEAKTLDRFMLHKNPDMHDEFLKRAEGFRKRIAMFEQYARKGDIEPLKRLVPEIDGSCNNCHRTFR